MKEAQTSDLSKNLTLFRKKFGYTQAEVAAKLNYSNKNVSKWENAETVPDVFILAKLADIYGITVDELLYGEKPTEDVLLRKKAQENESLRAKIEKLSLFVVCCLIATASVIASTVGFSADGYESHFGWMCYLFGSTLIFGVLYVFLKVRTRKHVISAIMLIVFLNLLFLSLYLEINCSPLIFVLTIPSFFLIFYFFNLMNIVKRFYRNKQELRRKYSVEKDNEKQSDNIKH